MPPRKSDRVRAIEEKLGKPSYSDTVRRASSVGCATTRPHGRRSSIRSATTDHVGGPRKVTDDTPREQFHEVEKRTGIKPEQHKNHHDLSLLVEEQSSLVEDNPRRRGSTEEEPGLGSLLGRKEAASQDKQWIHRQEPNTAATQPTTRASTVDLFSGTDAQQQPEATKGTVQETGPCGRGVEERSVHAVLQSSVLQSNQRYQQNEQKQEKRQITVQNGPAPPRGASSDVNQFFTSTPSPFLTSRRILHQNDAVPIPNPVMLPMPAKVPAVARVEPIYVVQQVEPAKATSTLLSNPSAKKDKTHVVSEPVISTPLVNGNNIHHDQKTEPPI
ncbi:uncharacterized protein MELLADRAFT_114765, partial [Melampsora larici-populina 98AG31]